MGVLQRVSNLFLRTRLNREINELQAHIDLAGALFYPLAQHNRAKTTLVVRSQRPASEIKVALSHMLSGIGSSIPFDLSTWEEGLALVLFPARIADRSRASPWAGLCWFSLQAPLPASFSASSQAACSHSSSIRPPRAIPSSYSALWLP